MKDSFGATTVEAKVRQHDGKLVDRRSTSTTTFTLGLQVRPPRSSAALPKAQTRPS